MSRASFLAVLLAVLVAGCYCLPTPTCPNVEDLRPCSCKRLAFGLRVTCSEFNKSSELVRAMRIVRDFKVHSVILHRLFLANDTLPEDLFANMHIQEIKVEQSELRFAKAAFSGLDSSLAVLNVAEGSRIKSPPQARFYLAKLTSLTELQVQRNNLNRVNDSWLNEAVPNVEKVVLDFNQIGAVEEHAFSQLKGLKWVSLADNKISEVKRSMLPRPAQYLNRIDLSFNLINVIPEDFFTEMPSLREVVLTQNDLHFLPEPTWAPVWEQLRQILLHENKLECDERMRWIRNRHRPDELEGTCISPKALQGKSIRELYK